ncbi:hypothetical protein BCR35DRAFT_306153 [Leucosporidium creatinivorum]|uniref:Uncharacterized protein n=1 Tax=Leucosporidium creatinivorum TaxID=106004 RepID=A0A1Y2EVR0_9BASI|nr:hypothetical protein BCR35DRAFT_306153 [Leucosporidium creatinivorum]
MHVVTTFLMLPQSYFTLPHLLASLATPARRRRLSERWEGLRRSGSRRADGQHRELLNEVPRSWRVGERRRRSDESHGSTADVDAKGDSGA